MTCNLQLPSPRSSTFPRINSPWRSRRTALRFPARVASSSPDPEESSEAARCATRGGESKGHSRVILVEKYSSGTSKRYFLDGESCITTFYDELQVRATDQLEDDNTNNTLTWLPDFIRDFVLPAGFPGSVSADYLEYMLWQFPTKITGWICHTLVASSLLKAVGIGFIPGTTAAASAAAIRWVSKDGIGAVGRLIIGGRFGTLFDDDPKQWRMYADFIGSAGSIFDLSTQLYPNYFLPLASLGNLTKAVARGLKDPSFRVIQNHFAVSGNLGDVAAKEEVWEVTAQLLGLGLGVLILSTPGLAASYPVLPSTWLGVRLFHLWLRYQSLSVLQLKTINIKRARILARSHILNSTVPGCLECNREENILSWQVFQKPRIILGVPLERMSGSEKLSSFWLETLLELYAEENYILAVSQHKQKGEFEVLVSIKREATSLSALRILWQSYWIYKNWTSSISMDDLIKQSLLELRGRFDHFIEQLQGAGWDINQVTLKFPKEPYIEEVDSL